MKLNGKMALILRYLRVCDIVVKKFTFAISSPDEFLYHNAVKYEQKPKQSTYQSICRPRIKMSLVTNSIMLIPS